MKLDTNQSLYKQGNFPQWLVYTEASGQDQSCIMRTSSAVNFEWIENHLNLLKDVNIQELCGVKQEKKEHTDKSIGHKRTACESIDKQTENKDKEREDKLKAL